MPRPRLLTLTLLFVIAACPRPVPPVLEEMSLEFDARGHAVALLVSRLDEGENDDSRREAAEYRERVERGDDPWQPSIAAAQPERDRLVLDREKGKLVRIERRLEIATPAGVEALFRDDAVRASFIVEGGAATLALVPAGTLARGDEAKEVDAAKVRLLQHLSRYLEATAGVYRYIDDHPDLREPLIGAMFEDLLSEEDRARVKDFDGDEDPVLAKLGDAWGEADLELQKFLFEEADKGRPALAWLSRRVYHPLRARLRVRVAGKVEAVTGFAAAADDGTTYEVPEYSFLAAFERATHGVVEPLPIVDSAAHALAESEGRGGETVPLANLVARKLVANPVPPDFADRLERELRPAPVYELRWSITAP